MKKAILLAGGRGTRLAPLTDRTPKPLMPFSDKTVIEYLLFRLAAHGVRSVMISVGYLADEIQKALGYEYGGMSIRYLTENTPLGTAGGLFFAEEYLSLGADEDFLVLSGDCVCDFDFSLGEAAHKKSGAEATIFTVESDSPCEYGIVLSDKSHRVVGFNEKPCWSQVNGNRINTGVYILNSKILHRIPHRPFDFSNDLFPELLKDKTLYEYPALGYWCDIGSPESYYTGCMDAIKGKIRGIKPENGFSADELSRRGVTAHEPFFVSDGASVAHGCTIGPNAIIGKGCKIGEASVVSDCILHPDCRIEVGSRVNRAILCRNVTVRKEQTVCRLLLPEGAVFSGQGASDGSVSFLSFSETVFPERDSDGAYILGSENTPPSEAVEQFGKAVFLAVNKGEKIGLQYEGNETVSLYAAFLASGIRRVGARFSDFGKGFAALSRFLAVLLHFDCFMFLCDENGKIKLRFWNRNGLCPSHDFERRLSAVQKSMPPAPPPKSGIHRPIPDCTLLYESAIVSELCAYLPKTAVRHDFSVAFRPDSAVYPEEKLFRKAFCALSGKIISEEAARRNKRPILSYSRKDGFSMTQGDTVLDFFHMLAAVLQKECRMGRTEFCLSDRFPTVLFDEAQNPNLFRYPEESVKRSVFPNGLSDGQYFLRDPILLCARVLSLLLSEQKSARELLVSLPPFAFAENRFSVADEKEKMRVIGIFSERCRGGEYGSASDEYEGIRIEYPLGTATLIPERAARFRVLTEAKSTEAAKSICEAFEKELSELSAGAQKDE